MIRLVAALVLLVGLAGKAYAQDSEITLLALNGKTGKPLAMQRILIFGGLSPDEASFHHTHFDIATDANGLAKLRFDPATTSWIEVFADYLTLCFSKPNLSQFSVEKIVTSGLSTPNYCSSIFQPVQAGRFIVFARRPTLREKRAW